MHYRIIHLMCFEHAKVLLYYYRYYVAMDVDPYLITSISKVQWGKAVMWCEL